MKTAAKAVIELALDLRAKYEDEYKRVERPKKPCCVDTGPLRRGRGGRRCRRAHAIVKLRAENESMRATLDKIHEMAR